MKRKSFILCLLALVAAGLQARQFDGVEQMYINPKQADAVGDWSKDNAVIGAYFFKGSNGQFASAGEKVGTTGLYVVTVPKGDWTHVIVTRHSGTPVSWANKWNQTDNMPLQETQNYIYEFWEGGTVANVGFYAPPASLIPTATTLQTQLQQIKNNHGIQGALSETIEVCSEAVGDVFALHPRVADDKSSYVYSDVTAHGWYKSTNGTTWTSVDGLAGLTNRVVEEPKEEQKKDVFTEKVGVTTWYYLYSANPKGRRLVKMQVGEYGKCRPTCDITSLECAVSAVNADDNTYALDGMVAFGVANGDLTISCDGVSTTIKEADAVSPVTFKLSGLPADKKKHTLEAQFAGGCHAETPFTAPDVPVEIEPHDITLTVYETTTIVPTDYIAGAKFVWRSEGMDEDSTHQFLPIGTFNHDTVVEYYYREYNPEPQDPKNLMKNGSYEDATFNYGVLNGTSTISDYTYWGYNPTSAGDFYDEGKGHVGATGGFAITQNAKKFARNYASLVAHDGSQYALFDAEKSESGKKRAWYTKIRPAEDGENALKKGATYIFSFWVANINGFGEMNNAARLQFRIEYTKNGTTVTDTMPSIDLNKYKDNLWHQSSSTYLAKDDVKEITISVVDRNTSAISIGNDFALDDIQFNLISSRSVNVRTYQRYRVHYVEPVCEITSFAAVVNKTAGADVACDETKYDLDLTVEFDQTKAKDKGYLYIKDETTDQIIHTSPTEEPTTPYHIVLSDVATDANTTHTLKAYFAKTYAGVDKGCEREATYSYHAARKFEQPVLVQVDSASCDNNTHTLLCRLSFENQDGALQILDGTTTIAYEKTANAGEYKLLNLVADGKTHTLTFNFLGTGDCTGRTMSYTAPRVPTFAALNESNVVAVGKVKCGEDKHYVVFSISYENQYGTLEVENAAGTVVYTNAAMPYTATNFQDTIFNLPANGTSNRLTFSFKGTNDCGGRVLTYTAPHIPTFAEPTLVSVDSVQCDGTTHALRFKVQQAYQEGALQVLDESGNVLTYTETGTANEYEIAGLQADGADHTLTLNFTGENDCTDRHLTYRAPHIPLFNEKDIQIVQVDSAACDATTHTLYFTMTYAYQHGALEVRDAANKVVYYNATPPATGLTRAQIVGLPADGAEHVLTFNFLGENDCDGRTAKYTAPRVPHVSAVTITADEKVICGHTTYAATVAVEAVNQTGSIEVLIDGLQYDKQTISAAVNYSKQFDLPLDASDPNGEKAHSLRVRFVEGANSQCCDETITFYQPKMTDLPEVRLQSVSRECESVGQLQIPYIVQKGEPTMYSLTVNNPAFAAVTDAPLSGSTIALDVPDGVGGGVYTATVIVKEDATACEALPVQFTFELAQGGWMYRKWDDVIFVSNADEQFLSYQWYENGTELVGETQQRLYNANGLTGNSYYCRIVTMAGDTVYTCEQTFEGVTRSADESQKEPLQVAPLLVERNAPVAITGEAMHAMVYTLSGTIVGQFVLQGDRNEIPAPEEAGVYVLRISTGSEQESYKLIVR